ncbi:MAG: insulinase family protein [Nanoarchaeota archaeon]|nr:insulinase family protein [Nanoarchaeota archaeon]
MDLRKNFRREVLPNGVTLLFEKRDFPVCFVSITSKIGAVYESEKEKGLTHLMEHLLLKGTKSKTGEEFDLEIEESGGEFNAATSSAYVKVWIKSPSKFTNRSLDILIDIVKNSLFNEKDIEKERKVVFEEMDMVNDSPEQYVSEKMESTLYLPPFSIPLIGTKENLKKFKRNDLFKKYREVFSPNNLIVSVVGNYDFKKLKKKIEKSFKKETFQKKEVPEIKKKISHIVEYKKDIEQSRFAFLHYSPLSTEKEIYSSIVLYWVLNGGTSSRLYRRLRHNEAIVYSSDGDVEDTPFYSFSKFEFGCSKNNIPKVKKAIIEEFFDVSKNLKKSELNSSKEKLLGDSLLDLESCENEEFGLAMSEINFGNAEEFYNFPKRIKAVKLEAVKRLAKEVVDGNYSTFTLLPKK